MIRFVVGLDGEVVPDLARKLPGRGVWVAATAEATALAARRGLFARAGKSASKGRAAKTRAAASADLPALIAERLRRRLLAGLGLARKAGWLLTGFEKCLAAVERGKIAVLIEAADGAHDGRRRLLSAARRSPIPPRLVGLFTSGEMGLALGGETVIHAAFLAGRGADRWMLDLERLSGFRPLFPKSWPESWPFGSWPFGSWPFESRPPESRPPESRSREFVQGDGADGASRPGAPPDGFGSDRTDA